MINYCIPTPIPTLFGLILGIVIGLLIVFRLYKIKLIKLKNKPKDCNLLAKSAPSTSDKIGEEINKDYALDKQGVGE